MPLSQKSGGRGRQISGFKGSLLYKMSSRITRATQRKPVLKEEGRKRGREERGKGKGERGGEGKGKTDSTAFLSFDLHMSSMANSYDKTKSSAPYHTSFPVLSSHTVLSQQPMGPHSHHSRKFHWLVLV